MALRANRVVRIGGWVLAALLLAAIAYTLGSGGFGSSRNVATDGYQSSVPEAAPPTGAAGQFTDQDAAKTGDALSGVAPDESAVRSGGSVPGVESMIVRTAAVDMQVEKVATAITAIRAAAKRYDAQVEQLSVAGGEGGPRPLPEAQSAYPTPANATVVLRVPADKLEAISRDIAKLGIVVSQSSSADDVTQQYVDMAARLKNLKAEEARLRSFFDQANRVTDLLAIESELSRVRGEIESMQAQVDYLERQVARATLTVTLTEPGPVIQPAGLDWGFTEAIRRGIQGAATLVTTMLFMLIALSPLILLGLGAWLLVRWTVRRRRNRIAATDEPAVVDASDEEHAAP